MYMSIPLSLALALVFGDHSKMDPVYLRTHRCTQHEGSCAGAGSQRTRGGPGGRKAGRKEGGRANNRPDNKVAAAAAAAVVVASASDDDDDGQLLARYAAVVSRGVGGCEFAGSFECKEGRRFEKFATKLLFSPAKINCGHRGRVSRAS